VEVEVRCAIHIQRDSVSARVRDLRAIQGKSARDSHDTGRACRWSDQIDAEERRAKCSRALRVEQHHVSTRAVVERSRCCGAPEEDRHTSY